MGYYLASAFFFVVYMVFGWIITGMLHLSGNSELAVRMVFMAVGVGAFGYIFQYLSQRQSRQQQQAQPGSGPATTTAGVKDEVDVLFRQAQAKLVQSRLGKDARLRGFPVFFVLGEPASAKTSVFVNSGTEPDLLAGQVYQAKDIISTRPANLWLAQNSIFLEAGGAFTAAPEWWVHLVKRLQPSRWRALFERKAQPARGALVCVDSELFLRPGADDALAASARNLNARLGEISHTLGIQLPVYVLFTKLDRLSCFTEFAGNLSDAEVNQVLGATLPMRSAAQGVYAEEEARLLTNSFNDLFYSLCDRRPNLLLREHDEPKLAKVYEFPREFRKLRNSLVRFLVDLGKPSQLRLNPFLRGYYFSGVRPLVKNEAQAAGRARENVDAAYDRDASGLFDADLGFQAAPARPAAGSVRTRRVPQWLFLTHLFNSVILQDRTALGASTSSASRQTLRRAGLIAACALLVGWAIALTVSWSNNRELENNALNAAHGIRGSESGGGARALPATDTLERLDTLRSSVSLLSHYEREGHPWSLGWGLYMGHEIYPAVRRIYFARFDQLLLTETQQAMLQHLRTRPEKAAENEGYPIYEKTYAALKAFLITTQFPQHSSSQFLPPVLLEYWASGRSLDPRAAALAQRQFDFYSAELPLGNPFPGRADEESVHHARVYLANFGANDRIYNDLIQEVSKQAPGVNFNRDVARSSEIVLNGRDMQGAFTAKGWSLMQEQIKNLKKDFGGEAWVLGDEAKLKIDPSTLGPELRARYQKSFIDNWRAYLQASSIRRYSSAADAAAKLDQLAGNQSFLMQLFCIASENTNVPEEAVKTSYQPVHAVEPAGCKTAGFVNEANKPYLNALNRLQSSLHDFATKHGMDQAAATQSKSDARAAHDVVKSFSLTFHPDTENPKIDQMTWKLLDDPITAAEAWIGNPELVTANAAAHSACGEVGDLARKYPFKSDSPTEATLQETEHIFRPGDGVLATFWESTLKNYADKSGNNYVAKGGASVQVSPEFLRFYNRAMDFSRALYKTGTKPRIDFAMHTQPVQGVSSETLVFDSEKKTAGVKGGEVLEFYWPGPGKPNAELRADAGGDKLLEDEAGFWATFRFFGDADNDFQENGNYWRLQWTPKQGKHGQPMRTGPDNTPVTFRFDLDLKGAPPIFRPRYLSGMNCPPGGAFR